jgi:transcriptional regulator with XRE-family HTH domain
VKICQGLIINNMKNEILLKLGNKIRYERIKRNLSQDDLADLIGLSKQSISALETGVSNIKFTTLYNIAKALDINLGDFSDFKL